MLVRIGAQDKTGVLTVFFDVPQFVEWCYVQASGRLVFFRLLDDRDFGPGVEEGLAVALPTAVLDNLGMLRGSYGLVRPVDVCFRLDVDKIWLVELDFCADFVLRACGQSHAPLRAQTACTSADLLTFNGDFKPTSSSAP